MNWSGDWAAGGNGRPRLAVVRSSKNVRVRSVQFVGIVADVCRPRVKGPDPDLVLFLTPTRKSEGLKIAIRHDICPGFTARTQKANRHAPALL